VQELADAFSVAYARFLDFQRLEAKNWALAEANERLKELDRLKSDFVSTVSHEFKSPLTAIRQFAELLRDGLVPSQVRRQQYYDAIVEESDRLTHLVDTILDVARIEAGRKHYAFAETDVRPLFVEVIEQYRRQAAQRGFRIEVELADDLPLLQADGEALMQAVSNLLDNAVKYSGEAKGIAVTAWTENRSVCMSVRDHGIGISKEELPRIFDRFYRGGSALTRQVQGTGLGLAVVKHIVEAHRGEVLVESEPGQGSLFTVKIPIPHTPMKRAKKTTKT